MSASLEEKFLASCQVHRGFKRTNEKTKKKHHARLPAQVAASSVSRSPGGKNRQERKDAVSGQEDEKHREDYREGKQKHMKEKQCRLPQRTVAKRQWCLGSLEPIVPSYVWQNDVKDSVNNTWQISPCLTEPPANTNSLPTHCQINTMQN